MMRLKLMAEYACGHEPKVIVEGKVNPASIKADLKRLADGVTTGGMVNFRCHCGRGAAFVEVWLDGRIIARTPASAFRGMEGAKLTVVRSAGGMGEPT